MTEGKQRVKSVQRHAIGGSLDKYIHYLLSHMYLPIPRNVRDRLKTKGATDGKAKKS